MIVAIVYGSFAPLHDARLRVAGRRGRSRGHRLVGVEVAGTQSDYRWSRAGEASPDYTRLLLFPRTDYWALSFSRVRRALQRALESVQPDVLMLPGWGFKESIAGLSWAVRRGVPRVVISDSQPIHTPRSMLKEMVKRFLVRRFQAGFACGAPHVRYLAELGLSRGRCFVGCDVVDNEFFGDESRQWRAARGAAETAPGLLSCLRLLPRKNVLGVLEVLARSEQWTWTIAGDGPQRGIVEERIRALGLQRRVRLLGHVDYSELPSVYARSDVYLQPSLSEPWGLAVNEAMACGLPVVVSRRCGCHEDLVQEGRNGYTFDPASPGGLASTLDLLLRARERWAAMGRASQQIVADWGLDRFAQNLWAACEVARRSASAQPGAAAAGQRRTGD